MAEATQTAPTSAAARSRAEAAAQETGAVVVEIYDQVYQLRGVDAPHIERLASIVDSKMRAVAGHGATVDSLRVAVLAALNLTDELLTLRARYDTLINTHSEAQHQSQTSVRTRAGALTGMLDEVLMERKAS